MRNHAAKAGEAGYISEKVARRRLAVIEKLAKRLSRADFKLEHDGHGSITISRNGAKEVFWFREKSIRGHRPLSDFERQFVKNRDFGYTLIPTGKLAFAYKYTSGPVFGQKASLDEITSEVEKIIFVKMENAIESKKKSDESAKLWESERQARKRTEQLRQQEEKKWLAFVKAAQEWQQNSLLELFVQELGKRSDFDSETLAFLHRKIAEADPFASLALLLRPVGDKESW